MPTVKRTATAVVDSVVRNPDALLWLTRLHEKDTHSHNRSLRTSIWVIAFARHLGLEKEKMNNLSIALLLCNIGKAKLPRELLEKEDKLDGEDLREYQKHVDLTLDALKIMGRTPQAIITIIRAHCAHGTDGAGDLFSGATGGRIYLLYWYLSGRLYCGVKLKRNCNYC